MLSKRVFLAKILPFSKEITENMRLIQKDFLWKSRTVDFKYEMIFCDFQNSGIKKCRRYNKNNKLAMRLDKETL